MYYKYEKEILELLKENPMKYSEIYNKLGVKKDAINRPLASLEEKGLLKKEVKINKKYSFTEEGKKYIKEKLPEVRLYEKIKKGASFSDLEEDEKRFGIKILKLLGVLEIKNGNMFVKDWNPSKWQKEYEEMKDKKQLLKRKLIKEEINKEISYHVTEKGSSFIFEEEGVSSLTSEMLKSGDWNKEFKEFDISSVQPEDRGKLHPLTRAIEKIKLIFAEMGFEEVEGNYIESAFWNFDALFQPQDHSARELADTFYLEGEEDIKNKEILEKVKKEHEEKWHYKWSIKEAKKRVLRTHTTAVSARMLTKIKETPKKLFAIGRVFRNEEIDYKHLAEFYQVEGIVVDENATFRDLLGILKIFYNKMGFEKIRFRPSYFPFTEPSLEIDVWFDGKKEWVELGGAGIFRKEVSLPLCGKYPVLAFGLSLERPLMLSMGLNDVRVFYKNNVKWLREH